MKRLFYFLPIFLIACANPFYSESNESPEDVVSITVTEPSKRLYKYGEVFDKRGLNVKVFRRNGTTYDETNPDISGFDSKREGIQTVTVSTAGKSYRFVVAVMLFALDSSAAGISASKGGNVTLVAENGASGSWTVHLFKDSAYESTPKINPNSGTSATFAAPTIDGTYIIAASIRINGVTTYRFYLLRVAP
jgi:hypothetical protein